MVPTQGIDEHDGSEFVPIDRTHVGYPCDEVVDILEGVLQWSSSPETKLEYLCNEIELGIKSVFLVTFSQGGPD